MDRHVRLGLVALVCLVAVAAFLGLTVYPLEYGPAESAVLAGAILLFGVWEFVLDDTTF